jgi:hypothetical protein
VRRRETSTPATTAEIVAQNRSCRWSHTSVDIAAVRSACTYIDTAATQAIESASAADSPLRPRRRPRFTHTRYAVSSTGAFASHRLITRSMCGCYATRSCSERWEPHLARSREMAISTFVTFQPLIYEARSYSKTRMTALWKYSWKANARSSAVDVAARAGKACNPASPIAIATCRQYQRRPALSILFDNCTALSY